MSDYSSQNAKTIPLAATPDLDIEMGIALCERYLALLCAAGMVPETLLLADQQEGQATA